MVQRIRVRRGKEMPATSLKDLQSALKVFYPGITQLEKQLAAKTEADLLLSVKPAKKESGYW